jgi:hypothetical protein
MPCVVVVATRTLIIDLRVVPARGRCETG